MSSCRSFRPPKMRWRALGVGKRSAVTLLSAVQERCLGEIPLRNAQLLSAARLDGQRVPLIRRGGIGVEDELVLLAQLLRDPGVDRGQLALLPDDEVRRAGVVRHGRKAAGLQM